MSPTIKSEQSGILLQPHQGTRSDHISMQNSSPNSQVDEKKPQGAKLKLAFSGLFLFTFLLYSRPQEMFPELFGSIQIIRIVAIVTLVTYFIAKLAAGEKLTILPLELKMILMIVLLGLLFTPIATSPQDSLNVLFDTFLKVVIMFVIMINLLNTAGRLRSIINLSVICGSILAGFAIIGYIKGNFLVINKLSTGRVIGLVDGMFGNPNDLAIGLDLLLPLCVALGLTSKAGKRTLYFVLAGVLAVGVIVTFSRGGFLGLVTLGGVMLWKLSKQNGIAVVVTFFLATGFLLAVMPSGYTSRLTTILSIEDDPTGSAQARRDLMDRAIEVASHNPIIGIGMGNYHIFSLREQVAHNSYLEISAELGVAGLIAYLIFMISPFRSLRRIERESRYRLQKALAKDEIVSEQRAYYFSVALQASIAAYMVCSFFGSVEYLWYIYYLVAYSIALRTIYAREHHPVELLSKNEATDSAAHLPPKKGVLWQTPRMAKGNAGRM